MSVSKRGILRIGTLSIFFENKNNCVLENPNADRPIAIGPDLTPILFISSMSSVLLFAVSIDLIRSFSIAGEELNLRQVYQFQTW